MRKTYCDQCRKEIKRDTDNALCRYDVFACGRYSFRLEGRLGANGKPEYGWDMCVACMDALLAKAGLRMARTDRYKRRLAAERKAAKAASPRGKDPDAVI